MRFAWSIEFDVGTPCNVTRRNVIALVRALGGMELQAAQTDKAFLVDNKQERNMS